jgi:hypothetical protein
MIMSGILKQCVAFDGMCAEIAGGMIVSGEGPSMETIQECDGE